MLFFGYNPSDHEQENMEETDFETQQILADVASVHSKRYYFEILELFLGQVSGDGSPHRPFPRTHD